MKKIAKILLCSLLALSLLCLCACGKKGTGDSSDPEAIKKLEGTYVLTAMTYSDGTKLTGDELVTELQEVWGLEPEDNYLLLNGDGTGVLCIYDFAQNIGYEYGKFWYSDFLDFGIVIEEEIFEFDEEGFPIENTTPTTEATDPTIPADLLMEFTVSGNTIALDPDGLGELYEFTKK